MPRSLPDKSFWKKVGRGRERGKRSGVHPVNNDILQCGDGPREDGDADGGGGVGRNLVLAWHLQQTEGDEMSRANNAIENRIRSMLFGPQQKAWSMQCTSKVMRWPNCANWRSKRNFVREQATEKTIEAKHRL